MAPPDVQPLLVLRRLALTKREREVAATRAHVLHTGDLCDDAAARAEDVEELGVGDSYLPFTTLKLPPNQDAPASR